MTRAGIVIAIAAAAACGRSEPAPAPATAAGPPACATLTGDNAVQTEMRRLECALARAVAAIGRDDLEAIPREIHVVHEARLATEHALEHGAWAPARGDRAAFVALDEAFHDTLVALVQAARDGDHAAAGEALGQALARCHGCHATFRPEPAAPPRGAPAIRRGDHGH